MRTTTNEKAIKLAIIKRLFSFHPDFFIAPFDQHTKKYKNNSKRLFQRFIIHHKQSAEYFTLNETLVSFLEENKLLDEYHLAITGKPKLSVEAVRQQHALSKGVMNSMNELLKNSPELVDLLYKNGNLIQDLAFDYEDYLYVSSNPPQRIPSTETENKPTKAAHCRYKRVRPQQESNPRAVASSAKHTAIKKRRTATNSTNKTDGKPTKTIHRRHKRARLNEATTPCTAASNSNHTSIWQSERTPDADKQVILGIAPRI